VAVIVAAIEKRARAMSRNWRSGSRSSCTAGVSRSASRRPARIKT